MLPTDIHAFLQSDVIGQEEALRYVAVAIFKHLRAERFGNLLLIGNSGTGKTTIMRSMERLYRSEPELADRRVVVIMNASTLANDEGIVDAHRLLHRLEERARQLLGPDAEAAEIGRYMEHATVCLDEIDKITGIVGGKPYVTGINIQQALLTLIEGEKVVHPITVTRDRQPVRESVHIDTGKMLFLCAGAFEGLYDQVFKRVTSPTSRVKLPTTTVYENGKVHVREYFTLRHHFKQEDLFDYGMQPQFMSRFDDAIILEDLNTTVLTKIFLEPADGVFRTAQGFFSKYGIALDITEGATRKIAEEASRASRIGARALKGIFSKVMKPYEFDPFAQQEVVKLGGAEAPAGNGSAGNGSGNGDGGNGHHLEWKLVVNEEVVGNALRSPLAPTP